MRPRLVLFYWTCMGVFISGCGTANQESKRDYPKAQVIGYGIQGSGWLGMGMTIPLPGKSSNVPPSSASGSEGAQPRQQVIVPMTG
jgi:hypothetical protein